MARYDAYPNPEASERKHTPYLLDVQNDYIDALTTRLAGSVGPDVQGSTRHPVRSVLT